MSAVKLRPYQQALDHETNDAFASGLADVGVNSPTGSGKTVFFSHKIKEFNGGSVAIAHRQELVSQISVALARNDVRHRIIGQEKLVSNINSLHMAELGRSYYDANGRCAAAGVDTLIRLKPHERAWCAQIGLVVMDEAHHCLRENKWGKGRVMFPQARGLHVSATWLRADGQGLGRHADGFVDTLVNAPTMRELIDAGYLTDYKVVSVNTKDLDLTGVTISSATGDLNANQLREAVHKSSTLVGDVVREYLQHAKGKLGVTFAVDVEEANKIARKFNEMGVRAEVVSAGTPDHLRLDILRRFRRREILQLVNVDLFGEGFDLPAIEVVSMARPTESWSLYCQQWGRVLRLMLDPALYPMWDTYSDAERLAFIAASEKPFGLILDHVGNIYRHMGPPDARTTFSLDRREKRSTGPSDAIPLRPCINPKCAWPYMRVLVKCPKCGTPAPLPALRTGPEMVDGNLILLTPEALAIFGAERARIDQAPEVHGHDIVAMSIRKQHAARAEAQQLLRSTISWWSGLQDALGRPDNQEKQSRFYFAFGIDTANAQLLGAPDAFALRGKICEQLLRYGIDGTVNMT